MALIIFALYCIAVEYPEYFSNSSKSINKYFINFFEKLFFTINYPSEPAILYSPSCNLIFSNLYKG